MALVIGFRQTLLTTFLFYQGLAYLGNTEGYWLAQLERGDKMARAMSGGAGQYLGGIDILVRGRDGDWVQAGTIGETGPIATNVQALPLPRTDSGRVEVRLRLTKGLWRLDYLALARLEKKVEPLPIPPAAVVRQKTSEFAADAGPAGTAPAWPIVTMPGDVYSLKYELPGDFAGYELFLDTQGYYLEWMRQSRIRLGSFSV